MRSRWLPVMFALGGCGFSQHGGGTDPDAPDAKPIDAKPIDAPPDASLCYGAGLARICLSEMPTGVVMLPTANIDTDGAATCTEVVTVAGVEMCVIAGNTVESPTGAVYRAHGSRPLVIIAIDSIAVAGAITVSSLHGLPQGAGASLAPCGAPGAAAGDDGGGGGGGTGGSFRAAGGVGGIGDLNNNGDPAGTAPGGTPAAAITLTAIRGGCPGTAGGDSAGLGGGAGAGGGAVYLIAGSLIRISGGMFAVGEGGHGGAGVGAGVPGGGGGGGGGSGGLVGLDAPMITVTGTIVANGGGGGQGGAIATGGEGGDGSASAARAFGGNGGDGGNGGFGSGGLTIIGSIGANNAGGAGGGGGAAGYVYVKGTLTNNGSTISPAPSLN